MEELRELVTMRDGTIATLRKKVEDMTEAMKTQDPWHAAAAKAKEEDDIVEALVKKMELLEKMVSEKGEKHNKDKDDEEVKGMKGFDSKKIKRPSEWDGTQGEYVVWSTHFVAWMATIDKKWKTVLASIRNYGSVNGALDLQAKMGEREAKSLLGANNIKEDSG